MRIGYKYIVLVVAIFMFVSFLNLKLDFKGETSPGERGTNYHSYKETVDEINYLVATYPNITHLVSLGKTYEGRDILGIKISDNPTIEEEEEPEVYINGCHHAREWMSIEVVLYIMNKLLGNYTSDPEINYLVNNRQIWIVPCVNPDGRIYDGDDDPTNYMNWRKNRVPNPGGSYGVDLNRNYDISWSSAGSSDPTSETYRGKAPFSENETQAIRNLVNAHRFVASISYHSYWQKVFYVGGGNNNPEEAVARDLANNMANLITNTAGDPIGYSASSGGGAGMDYTWLALKKRVHAFIIELYPSAPPPGPYNGFHPPADKVPYVCRDNINAALYLIKVANNVYHVLKNNNDVGIWQLTPFYDECTYPRGNYTFKSYVVNYGKTPQSPFRVNCEIKKIVGGQQTTVYAKTQYTSGIMNQNDTQILNWSYNFIDDAIYKIKVATDLNGDQYLPNNERTIMINISGNVTQGSISGKITNSIPIENATITAIYASNNTIAKSTLSNISGKFNLTGLSLTTYNLNVKKTGYKEVTIQNIALTFSQPHKDVGVVKLQPLQLINWTFEFENPGWYMFSIPIEPKPNENGIKILFSNLSYNTVLVYNSSDEFDHWKSYDVSKPEFMNDLANIDYRYGIWINITNRCTLTVRGYDNQEEIRLKVGWNLIGYPSLKNRIIADALKNVSYTKIQGFDPKLPYHLKDLSQTDYMKTGNAYWIYVLNECIWRVVW